jgi:hypothetical protein
MTRTTSSTETPTSAPRRSVAGLPWRELARDPARVETVGGAVSIVPGDARSSAVAATIRSQDAVLSAFGQQSFSEDDVQEVVYRNCHPSPWSKPVCSGSSGCPRSLSAP